MSEIKSDNNSTLTNSLATKVAVLVLNWRKCKTTIACLKSLTKSKNVNIEVYLLDNQSTQDSLQCLKQNIDNINLPIHLFSSYQNLGFAGGVNYLIDQIEIEKFDYFFLLNNDAKVRKNTIPNLIKESKSHHIDLIGPVTKDSPESCSRSWPSWIFGIRKAGNYNPEKKGWHTCGIDGSALLITQETVTEIIDERDHLLKNDLFMYTEDTELGLFSSGKEYELFITSNAIVEHPRGEYKNEKRHSLTYYYMNRNRLILADEYLHSLLKPLFHVYYVISRILILTTEYLRGHTRNGSAIWQGLVDGYIGVTGKWEKHT